MNNQQQQQWVCSPDFILHRTPSRKDNITYQDEQNLRRRGTSLIRQVAMHLKLKPICKETAYVYFHRFYILRSLKKYEPRRIAMACLYLACKYEDHPTFKEHLVRISYLCINRTDLSKNDKEYAEWCDRLIRDENLLLQVLGFNLGVRHFQMLIVQASQQPIEGTTKDLYTTAYKISSELNRLTMLCVEHPSPILANVCIYLASIYKGIILPEEWTTSVSGGSAQDVNLVVKIGDEHKERMAKESDIVKTILKESGVKSLATPNAYCSPGGNCSRGSTPSHPSSSMYFGKNDQLSQQILTTFSPDSAYSSNSSHSPPENAASYGSGGSSRGHAPQAAPHHQLGWTQQMPVSHQGHGHGGNSMMGYPNNKQSKQSMQPHLQQPHHHQQHQQSSGSSYSYPATATLSSCYTNASIGGSNVNSNNKRPNPYSDHTDSSGQVRRPRVCNDRVM